ncbi:MAG: glycosyltransferase [Caldilineaceae bacterium]
MKPIRVLQIIAGFAVEGPLGGIERFGIELARQLQRRGFDPILCGLWDFRTPFDQQWVERLNAEGITAFTAAPKDDDAPYRNYRDLLQGILRQSPRPVDIIHSHSEFGDVAALLLRRRLEARALVRTVHNEREWRKRPLRRLLLTNLLYPLFYDQELGVAQQVVDNLNRRVVARGLGRTAGRMYNALNFDRFTAVTVDRAAKRVALGLPAVGPIIGSVGRLTEQKGYHLLLEAVPQVLAHHPAAHFVLVGSGDQSAALVEQAHRLQIAAHVHFTGARGDIEELFGLFDLFVSSSLWEGLPTVILESMAAGVPVVATTVSGSSEQVIDGVTGRLVTPGDPVALAEGMIDLLGDPAKAAQLSAAARPFAMARFSIQAVAEAHVQLYHRLIATTTGSEDD